MASKQELVEYYHKACFVPTKSEWLKAIKKGFFISWPRLTAELVNQHLKPQLYTALGHMQKLKQGIQSTKIPTTTNNKSKTNMIFVKTVLVNNPTDTVYTNLCGRFPHRSLSGNNYIFVAYNYDSNSIIANAMKNRSDGEMLWVYNETYEEMTAKGLQPRFHILDNEASTKLKQAITANNLKYQLVPPGNHRVNNAD